MAENGQDNSDQLKNIAGSRPSSATKGGTMHWFAYVGPDPPEYEEDTKARLKTLKDRENDERQKKLDELKAQALAAHRFKEKKEMERRQRIDELRHKEGSRRQQVEERKKAINDAERDRLESILKRNQEREARIEAKKRNERHSMVFAFGSSTPRMLEPTDSVGSFWGHRKATSTQNIPCTATPLTRRQSERELDGGSKKRATSAGGLERSVEDMRMSTSMYEIFNWGHRSVPSDNPISSFSEQTVANTSNIGTPSQIPAGCASGYVGRRRTDLMPTIPSKESPSASVRKSFARSPGRAYSMSRLDQLAKPRKRPTELPSLAETTSPPSFRPLNRPQQSSVSRSMSHLAVSKVGQQPQRPLRKSDSRSMHQLSGAAPLPVPRTTRAAQLRQQKLATTYHEAPSRPSSSLSQQSTSSVTSSVTMRTQPIAAPRRPRPISIAVTGITNNIKNGLADPKKTESKPPLPKTRKSSLVKSTERLKKKSITSPTEGSPKLLVSPTSNVTTTHSPIENMNVVREIIQTVTKETKTSENSGQTVSVIKETKSSESSGQIVTESTEQITVTSNAENMDNIANVTEQQVSVESSVATTQPERAPEPVTTENKADALAENAPQETKVNEQQNIETSRVEEKPVDTFKVEETLIETFKIDEKPVEAKPIEAKSVDTKPVDTKSVETTLAENSSEVPTVLKEKPSEAPKSIEEKIAETESTAEDSNDPTADMTASMTKIRINTEEEAKAALAERRRIAREEAEKQAELERRRIEEEAMQELERQRREEEQQRILIEQMRAAEQERLEEAIRETKRRDEEERLRREEENRMKILKEEAERKAREEAERQKAELQERLKNEEKEREARRKRVEAIMSRTRGKNNSSTPPQTEEKNEENKPENLNGSKVDASENGHKNGKEIETVDNIIPVDSLKNANTVNNVDNLSTDDTLNSNNSWQHNTQTDLLM